MYPKGVFRTASLLSRRRIVATTSRASFSSNTAGGDGSSSDVYTGKVKFYRRDHRYGIIVPDDNSIGEVFVHRSGILSDDDNLNRPFLQREERVKFTTAVDEGKNSLKAQNVTLEDGTPVPKYRGDHVGVVTRYSRLRFADAVHDILTSEDISSKSSDIILKEIQEVHDAEEKLIKEAEEAVNAERRN